MNEGLKPFGPSNLPPPGRMRMGLRPLNDDPHFLESLRVPDRMREKRRLWAREGRRVLDFQTGAQDAIEELRAFVETALGESLSTAVPSLPAAGLAVGEDLCLLQQGRDGRYRLTAGAVFFPSGWLLSDKLGKTLGGIHDPVPHFNDELLTPVERVFERLEVDAPVTRDNWGVSELEDLFRPGGHSAEPGPLWLRCERQTLARLPATRAVLFTIGTFMAPIEQAVADHPEWARYILSLYEKADPDHLAYKGMDHRKAQLMPILEKALATPA